jgi:MOSC domain-containing protein YiiM
VSGRIVQLSVSRGGVPKTAVSEVRIRALGLDGDAHREMEHHGGPDRAVCLYAMEMIVRLRAEGHDIVPGDIGENVTVEGLDWSAMVPGCHVLLGGAVLLQITRYTRPCAKITRPFKKGYFGRVSQKRHPGWSRVYARVLTEGSITQGDPVRLLNEVEAAEVHAAASR